MEGSSNVHKHVHARRSILRCAIVVVVVAAAAAQFHWQIITSAAFLGALTETWAYQNSHWYLAYLRSQWEKLPEAQAAAIPEIQAGEFTQELFWEITDNLRKPVVIRGAIKDSVACKQWGRDYFVENYPDELVLVRENLNDTQFRIEKIPMRDFWAAYEHGKNVTIFTSSSIFRERPELLDQAAAPFEDQLRDKSGNRIFLNQFFITPGGRTFFHSEVGGNTFRQIAGRKLWTLISPEHNAWLCPHLAGEFIAIQTCIQSFEPDLREQWFKRIPRQTTVLEAGDILYNPPWYWHDIITLDANRRQTSLAGRMGTRLQSFQNGVFQSLLVLRKQLKLMPKVKAAIAAEGPNRVVEDYIATTWAADCRAEGRNDCESSLRLASTPTTPNEQQ